MKAISIKALGIGDGLQFSSLPENYYRMHNEYLVDLSKPWFFDHNPYVCRNQKHGQVFELWNFPFHYPWPRTKRSNTTVYLSNAEIWASLFQVPVKLNRPRLYRFESFPMKERERILIHATGKSHGSLPHKIIDHILNKYKGMPLYQIGLKSDIDLGIPRLMTNTMWDLAKEISECRMVIGPDSGPAWIGLCYPDVIVKKIRLIWQSGTQQPENWIPLEITNCHSHWDDRAFQIYNTTEDDIGFTQSYLRI